MAGDHDALVRLLETAQPDIRRFARQQCRSGDAALSSLPPHYREVVLLRGHYFTGASAAAFLAAADRSRRE